MLKRIGILLTIVLLAAIGAACNAANPSVALQSKPQSWIDEPLDGSALPLAPVDVISHSSDSAHIVLIELAVNGVVMRSNPNTASAQTLVTMHQAWEPNAPGNYTLQVRAQNSSGAWGEYASAVVTIGGAGTPGSTSLSTGVNVPLTEEATTIAEAETATASRTSVGSAAPTIGAANQTPTTSSAVPQTTIAFYSDVSTIVVGGCTTLHWQVSNAVQVFLDNVLVNASGAKSDCPRQTFLHTLRVITLDHQTVLRQLTVASVPATSTPLPLITPEPPTNTPRPPATPRSPTATRVPTNTATSTPIKPTLTAAGWTTNQFFWPSGNGCLPTTVTISVSASDPSGIHSVQIYFWLADQSSGATTSPTSAPMIGFYFPVFPASYSRTINSTNIPGYNSFQDSWLRFYIVATNNNGGKTQSATYANNITLTECILK